MHFWKSIGLGNGSDKRREGVIIREVQKECRLAGKNMGQRWEFKLNRDGKKKIPTGIQRLSRVASVQGGTEG